MVDLNHLVHHPVIQKAGGNRKHQLARIKLGHAVLQLLLGPVNRPEDPVVGGEGLLQGGFHICQQHHRRVHVHHINIGMLRRLLRAHKSLSYYGGSHAVAAVSSLGIEHGVVTAMSEGIHDKLCQQQLLRIMDFRPLFPVESRDEQHIRGGSGPDHIADPDISQHAVQFLRGQILKSGKCHRPVIVHLVAENHQPVPAAVQRLQYGLPVGQRSEKSLLQLLLHAGIGRIRLLKGDGPGIDERLIFRLSEIQSVIIDVFLHHRIDKIGDIPVHIDIFPDSGGGDLHQLLRKFQLDELSPDLLHHIPVVPGIHFLVSDSAEGDVIHFPDDLIARILLIEGGVGDDVGAHHQVELPVREYLLQPQHVVRIPRT